MKNRRESILIIEKYYNTSLSLSQKKKEKLRCKRGVQIYIQKCTDNIIGMLKFSIFNLYITTLFF